MMSSTENEVDWGGQPGHVERQAIGATDEFDIVAWFALEDQAESARMTECWYG
jgi:hypothetical protein